MARKEKSKDEEPREPQREEKTVRVVKRRRQRGAKQAAHLSDVVATAGLERETPSLVMFTLHFLYKNLYIIGIRVVRHLLALRRRGKFLIIYLLGNLFEGIHRLARFCGRTARRVTIRIKTPLRRIRDTYQSQLPAINAERLEGNSPIRHYLPVVELVLRLAGKVLATIFNYVAPVAAAVFLLLFVQDLLDTPVALLLEYDGEVLGYIESEAVFEDAAQIVRERTLNQEDQVIAVGVPSFALVEPHTDDYLDRNSIADMIISHSGEDTASAFGLFVGGRLEGAVTDKDAILDALDEMKEQGAAGIPGERLEFAKSIKLTEALYPASSVVDPGDIIDRLQSNEEEDDYYVVQEGDTPTEISDKLGMSYSDLLLLNPQIEEELWPGDELQIRVARAYLPVQSIYTTTYEEEIPFQTEEIKNGTFAIGYENVTVEGVNGKKLVVAEVTQINGIPVDEKVIDDSQVLVEPVNKRVVIGVNDARRATSPDDSKGVDMSPSSSAGSGIRFIWPTVGGTRATTYSGHTGNGVDIAYTGGGVPIYASAAGQVTQVVNGYTGYGHYIMISHEGGYTTLYAHNSSNHVRVGEYVEQGQVIATMGRTGWATGNHVHFEIRYNGRYQNPTQYIGYSQ